MKKNLVLRLIQSLWLLAVMFFFNACAEEVINISPTDNTSISIIPTYAYKWDNRTDADTLIYECNQRISYSFNGRSVVLNPTAVVKLYPLKDTISFNDNKMSDIVFSDEDTRNECTGSFPDVNKIEKDFYFTDGQTVRAEIYYEGYNLVDGNDIYELPYVIIDNCNFIDASCDEILNEENLYFANLDFSFEWKPSIDNVTKTTNLSASYIKKKLCSDDELLDVSYNKGCTWHNGKQFSVYVEKIETWRNAGTYSTLYQSPIIDFYISGKEDKSISVNYLNFEYSENYNQSDVVSSTSDGWNIKQYIKYITLTHSNGIQSFSNDFEFPVFEISLIIDNQNFNFDLMQNQYISTNIVSENNKNTHTTNVKAYILGRSFEACVYTYLEINEDNVENPPFVDPNPEPDPEPNPDPVPTPEPEKYKYGKIVDYSVTAVYDANATFENGKVTKKCVMIRFEHGYLWGVCEYNEDFPQEFTYTTAGYTGFNSVARDEAFKPFELARAVDINEGIAWYSENNKLISGIDILSCKILGWENIPNGKYSAFINSYKARYSNSRYTLTLTSPNGASKTIYSE